MPKVSVYLPDEMYARARSQGVSLSAVTQTALEAQLAAGTTEQWIDHVASTPSRIRHAVDTPGLLDEVRDEFGQ